MKVFVSVDMEGVSGLTDPEEMRAGGRGYERGCELMTADANAAVRAAFDAGADQVVVTDSHGRGKNLRADLIDERCTLIRGPHMAMRMGEGLDASFDVALYVGYHARAGAERGVLNHTWMGREIQDLYLNGEVAGEIRLMAGYAGSLGVPVGLVAGDEAACVEARDVLGDVPTVAVKAGHDRYAAELVPPARAQEMIYEAALRSLRDPSGWRPLALPSPYTLAIDWNTTSIAQSCSLIPGVTSTAPRVTEFTSADYAEIVGLLGICATLAGEIGCTGRHYG
ncbi:M55 family metallopeptidase [Actinomadura montaniterrae]|uniref:M55 family metallopeptidase n=1 Tax=Actinomadura montaniterrae TaxID=1803903 RepID=A0A6L3VQF1_9ACTN|nr:M55 family metallopeptidase [Actinomadura montaniterrae]KAB2369518.1 M55 family metallopeptidase [Actinomadura montaniterrae]